MDQRIEMLRRHIALFRRCLSCGVPADLALVYLAEIDKAEQEIEAASTAENKHKPGRIGVHSRTG